MVVKTIAWDDTGPARLVSARTNLGHTQGTCAGRLRELGSRGAQQPSVSRWEREVVNPRGANLMAIRQYIGEAEDAVRPSLREPDETLGSEDAPFQAAVRELTSEPLLGPRQAAFVDALTERLRAGPEMSTADDDVRRDLREILRFR